MPKILKIVVFLSLPLFVVVGIASLLLVPRAAQQPVSENVPDHFIANTQTDAEATAQGRVLAAADGALYFTTPSSQQVDGGVVVLDAAMDPQITLESYQRSGTAKITLYSLSQADVLNALVYTKTSDSDWGASIKQRYVIDASKLQPVSTFEQSVPAATTQRNVSVDLKLPISGIGTWWVRAELDGKVATTMLVRTHLAGLIHRGDNENIFWIQDSSATAVGDAEIQVFNVEESVKTIQTLRSDGEGKVTTGINDAMDIAVVSRGEDYTMIPIRLTSMIQRQGSSDYNSIDVLRKSTDKAFLFTDRFLYKPGDTIFFKAIIRDDDDAQYTIAPQQYDVSLNDQDGQIWQRSLALSGDGSLDGQIPLSADQPVGYLQLNIRDGEQYVTSLGLQVARYRTPDATLTVQTDKLFYQPSEKITATIQGKLFLGQPIARQEVKYKIYQSEARIQGPYQQIQFAQIVQEYAPTETPLYEGTLQFDDTGIATLSLPAVNTTGFRQFWIMHVQYLDAASTATTEAVQVLVNPGDFVIDRVPEDERPIVGEEHQLPLQLHPNVPNVKLDGVQITGKILKSVGGTYTVFKADVRATTDAQGKAWIAFTPTEENSYRFEVEAKDAKNNPIRGDIYISAVDRGNLSAQREKIFTLTSDRSEYRAGETATIRIATRPEIRHVLLSVGRVFSRRFQIVTLQNGVADVSIPMEDAYKPNVYVEVMSFYRQDLSREHINLKMNTNDRRVSVKIQPSQQRYLPGETATFDITARDADGRPVQTDLAFWVFDKSLLELHGTYFSGIFDRFWNARWFGIPTQHSYQGIWGSGAEGGGGCFSGETLITMADGSRKRIDQVRKGEQIQTFSSVEDARRVSATVADAYHVNVAGYLIVNGDLKMTAEHILWVNGAWIPAGSLKIGDQLLGADGVSRPVRSLEWVQGAFTVYNLHIDTYHTFFANGIYVHNQKGDVRSRFKDVAYWNPHVQTDAQGMARVTVTLPDNLTTWVTAAVAANAKTQVGEGMSEFIVTKDVVMRPIFPSFLRVGDQITLTGLLQNYSAQEDTFAVRANFSAGVLTSPDHSVTVPSKGMRTLGWSTTVQQPDESAQFQIRASATRNTALVDDVTQKLPVYAYGSWQSLFQQGEGIQSLSLSPSQGSDPSQSSAIVRLSVFEFPRLAEGLKKIIDDAVNEWTTAEKTLIAASIVKQYGTQLGVTYPPATLQKVVTAAQKSLVQRTNDAGVWHGDSNTVFQPARRPLEALVIAKRAGFDIDQRPITKALQYLRTQPVYGWEEKVDQQYIFSLFPDEKDLPRVAVEYGHGDRARTARAIVANARQGFVQSSTELSELMQSAKISPVQAAWVDAWTGPRSGDRWTKIAEPTVWSARALLALQADTGTVQKALRYLHRNARVEYEEFAQLALATVDYYTVTQQFSPDLRYTVSSGGQVLQSGSVTPHSPSIAPLTFTAAQVTAGQPITVSAEGKGKLFVQQELQEFFPTRELGAKSAHLTLERKYFSTKTEGEPTKAGDLVRVQFTITGLGVGERQVTIADAVPAGLMVIDTSLDNGTFDQNTDAQLVQTTITPQGVTLQFDHFGEDTGVYSYFARVISEGVFDAPPAVVYLASDRSIQASSTTDRVVIDGQHALETIPSTDDMGEEDTQSIDYRVIAMGVASGLVVIVIAAAVLIGRRRRKKKLEMMTHATETQPTPVDEY